MSKNKPEWHILKAPYKEGRYWIVDKFIKNELCGKFSFDTKIQAEKAILKLTLLQAKITDSYRYQYSKDNKTFYYFTEPVVDRDTGTFSFCLKDMETKETVKFFDNIATVNECLILQKQACNILEKAKVVLPKKTVPKKRTVRLKSEEVSQINLERITFNTIESVLDGRSRKEIVDNLEIELKDRNLANTCYNKALDYFKSRIVIKDDLDTIVNAHIAYYEKIYRYFDSIGYTTGRNKALLHKEKLLGYHRHDNILEFNQENIVNYNKSDQSYNLTKLSQDEKQELDFLLSKIQVSTKGKIISKLQYELEKQVKRELFKESYFEFFKWCFTILFPNEKYEDAFHIKYLCDVYQDEVERILRREEKKQDLIVNIPPRTSKSLITSVCLLAWMWIKDPTLPMISVSFDEDLSLLNAQYSKDIINSDQYKELFGDLFKIRNDVNSKGFFMNDKGGFRLSKTTGSNITGHKGVVIVVDDPQNPKTAESEVHRKSTIEYYTKSLYNRLTPINLGVRIIIMQRLHANDLTGYLLKENPEGYRHINLPATLIYKKDKKGVLQYDENNHPLYTVSPQQLAGEYRGGLLDPIRLNTNILTGFKKTLGSRGYAGQYDQDPSPDEGGIWKVDWFDIIRAESLQRDIKNEPVHFIIDSAYTAKTENDPTAILTCFKRDNRLYILDVREVWLEFPQLIKFLKQHFINFQGSGDSKIFVEPKASGKSIVQQMRVETMLNIIESTPPDVDKTVRAHSNAPVLESRRVALVDGSYIPHYLEQVRLFPNADHDDMIDTTNIAVDELLLATGPDFAFI